MLALLAATLTEPLIRVNAIKNVATGAANLAAALIFARYAPVDWALVPLLALTAILLVAGLLAARPRMLPAGQP